MPFFCHDVPFMPSAHRNRTSPAPAVNYGSVWFTESKNAQLKCSWPECSDAQSVPVLINMPNKLLSGQNFRRTSICLYFVVLKGHLPQGLTCGNRCLISSSVSCGCFCFFCRVIQSNNPAIPVGSCVAGRCGWRTHTVSDGTDLTPIMPDWPKDVSLSLALGTIGMPGWDRC